MDVDLHAMGLGCINQCKLDLMPFVCINVCGEQGDQVARNKQHRTCTGFRKEVQEQVAFQMSLREYLAIEMGRYLSGFDPAGRGVPGTFGPDEDWALVLFCKSGRHRSVACAALMQLCLAFLGWKVTMHFEATDLSPTCGGQCPKCRGPSVKSAMALSRMWESLRLHLPTALLPGPLRLALNFQDLAPGPGPVKRESKRPRL
jgi:hypothetical protein